MYDIVCAFACVVNKHIGILGREQFFKFRPVSFLTFLPTISCFDRQDGTTRHINISMDSSSKCNNTAKRKTQRKCFCRKQDAKMSSTHRFCIPHIALVFYNPSALHSTDRNVFFYTFCVQYQSRSFS